jgi:cytochrome c553
MGLLHYSFIFDYLLPFPNASVNTGNEKKQGENNIKPVAASCSICHQGVTVKSGNGIGYDPYSCQGIDNRQDFFLTV